MEETAMKGPNNEAADIPDEEDCKPPANKRPRRKAALKSEELTAVLAKDDKNDNDDDDVKKRPRRKATKKSSKQNNDDYEEEENEEEDSKATKKSSKQNNDDYDEGEEEDEEDSKPAAKKRPRGASLKKSESSSTSRSSAPIPLDAMVNVMEMLPPRSLYNIALTCKSLRQMVTTKMVVSSALIHGGNAKKTIEELYALMSNHSMHVPSPLRLLRLANGKYCEFCPAKTNHVRPGVGVFACWDCLVSGSNNRWNSYGRYHRNKKSNSGDVKLTKAWKTSWARYGKKRSIYHTILHHPRVASKGYSSNHYFWLGHRTDVSGESIGPLAVWDDVDNLCEYYDKLKADAAAKEAAAAAAKSAASNAANAAAVATVYDNEEEEEEAPPSLNNGEWIEHYLTKNNNAPPKSDYAEFNDAYTNTLETAERVLVEREELKKSKRDNKMQVKLEKVEKMLEDLRTLLDEPFRERLLTYGKENYLKRGSSTSQCMYMETPFIDTLLAPYLKSPSKMTKKKIKEMAEQINAELARIEKLLDMDFLSDDDEFEAAAKAFLRECFPSNEELYVCETDYGRKKNALDDVFLKLVQGGHSFGALCYLRKNNLSPILMVTEPSASLVQASKYLDETSLKQLAKKAWWKNTPAMYRTQELEDDSWPAKAFTAGHEYFGAAMTKVDNFGKWLDVQGKFGEKVDEDARSVFLNEIVQNSWNFEREFVNEEDCDKIWERYKRWAAPLYRND
jgi:hypothetical protein